MLEWEARDFASEETLDALVKAKVLLEHPDRT
jgi:hypothetical protein